MIKEYKKDDIAVVWDNSKCIYSQICCKGLPMVFKPEERPWIQTENESKKKIIAQVKLCPTGALSIK